MQATGSQFTIDYHNSGFCVRFKSMMMQHGAVLGKIFLWLQRIWSMATLGQLIMLLGNACICRNGGTHRLNAGASVILDFSKAFDKVPQWRLLGKLDFYGIRGNLPTWAEAFLIGRTQSVLVDGIRSKEEDVHSGVPQGTVLGPLMFLLYIKDLPAHVAQRSSCGLFADDCLLYRPVESIEDQVQLQRDLRNLEQWASEWGMVFNRSKCYVMTVNRGLTHRPYLYELCGTILQSVDNEKYLGVKLTGDLSWSLHINNITTEANQKLGFIKRNLKGSPQYLKKLSIHRICKIWPRVCLLRVGPTPKEEQGQARESPKESRPLGVQPVWLRH